MVFSDRKDAGRRLAEVLRSYRDENVLVLGIPRGGVIVAAEVAKALNAPLDVIIPRKIGAPFNEELALGAAAPDGTVIFDERALSFLNLREIDLKEQINREMAEMERRTRYYRKGRGALDCRGKTVILIDDGIATGMTAKAALRSLRKQEPASLVLAVPVASREAAAELHSHVDNLICLHIPGTFYAVGQFYKDFRQSTDEEVITALEQQSSFHYQGGAGKDHQAAREPGDVQVVQKSSAHDDS